MHPARIAGHNILYEEPKGYDRKNLGVPWPIYARRVRIGESYLSRSAWFPTYQELLAMANGAPVILIVDGEAMQPTKVEVGTPADKLNPLPVATNVYRSLMGTRAVTITFEQVPTDEQIALLKQHLSGAAR